MQRTEKIRTLEPLEYHISGQISTLRLYYVSTSLIFPTEGIYSSLLLDMHKPDCVILCFQCTGFQNFPKIPKSFAQTKL